MYFITFMVLCCKTRSELARCEKNLHLLREELGKDLSSEYCKACVRALQDVAKSMLTMLYVSLWILSSCHVINSSQGKCPAQSQTPLTHRKPSTSSSNEALHVCRDWNPIWNLRVQVTPFWLVSPKLPLCVYILDRTCFTTLQIQKTCTPRRSV